MRHWHLNMGPEGVINDYTVILSFRDHHHLGQLTTTSNFKFTMSLNDAWEISFDVYKYLVTAHGHRIIEPLWDQICDFKYVYVPELNTYFEIYVTEVEENSTVRQIVGFDAGYAELSKSKLYNFEVNTEGDILRKDYVRPTVFYDPARPESSLLHRCLDRLPTWNIGHVDNSLWTKQRTFTANDEYLYDFLQKDVATELDCIFQYDTVRREINAYDLRSECVDCGKRGRFQLKCPFCGSRHLEHFGKDTMVMLDVNDFSQQIKYETDEDAVKTCFHLYSGDENFDRAIRDRNPNGSNDIYYFSDDIRHDMPKPLLEKLDEYWELHASYQKEYNELTDEYYKWFWQEWYLTHNMMPTYENQNLNAKQSADLLSAGNLSPVGVTDLTDRTSQAWIEHVIETYAKVYVHSGIFKIKVNTISWTVNNAGWNSTGTWTGTITVENRNNVVVGLERVYENNFTEGDIATTPVITVEVLRDVELYVEQNLEEMARKQAEKEKRGDVFEILTIKEPDALREAVKLYSLNRLISLRDAYQGCIDIMHGVVQDVEKAELYEKIYTRYKELLGIYHEEIYLREQQIQEAVENWQKAQEKREEIQNLLNLEDFLGPELFKEFKLFCFEDTYTNPNFVSVGYSDEDRYITDSQMLKDADNYYRHAYHELVRSGEWQHTISGKFIDFVALPQFIPFRKDIELGNWLTIKQDEKFYRLRLIQIEYEHDNPQNLGLVFSDVMKVKDSWDDNKSIHEQVHRMGTSFGSVARKADWAKEKAVYVDTWTKRGIDLSQTEIVSNADHQDVKWGKNGLWLRRFNEYNGDFDPEQIRTINNGIYYTPDNWESIKAGLGKFQFPDPKNNYQIKDGYGIIAETIVGQVVLAEDVGIWNNDGTILLNQDGYTQIVRDNDIPKTGQTYFRIARETADGTYDVINISDQKLSVNLTKGDLRVDTGNVHLNGSNIYMNAQANLEMDSSQWKVNASKIDMEGTDFRLKAKSKFDLEASELKLGAGSTIDLKSGSDLNLEAGVHLNLKGSEIFAESIHGKIEFRAGTDLVLIGNNIDMKGSKIDMSGLTTINEAVQISKDGYLTANDATFNDVKLNNINGIGHITFHDAFGTFSANGAAVQVNESKITATGNAYFGNAIEVGTSNKWGASYPTLLLGSGSLVLEEGDVDVQNGNITTAQEISIRNEVDNNSYVSTFATQSSMQVYSDYGFGTIDGDGKCYVEIDPTFDVLVDGLPWVFVQGYGGKEVHVDYVDDVLFVVKGKPGTFFAWRLDSLRAGHEDQRLTFHTQETNLVKDMDDSIELTLYQEMLETQQVEDYDPLIELQKVYEEVEELEQDNYNNFFS